MRVVEIFDSIQGEGPYIGTPMVFVRLHGCNLSCDWCDTKYALGDNGYKEMTPEKVFNKVMEYKPQYVCFTGGEPLLQIKELLGIIRSFRQFAPSVKVHVETNGTIVPKLHENRLGDMYLGGVDFWAISPKEPYDIETLTKVIDATQGNLVLKFVVKNEEDVKTAANVCLELATQYYNLPVVIQPERYTFEGNGSRLVYCINMENLVVWCQKHLKGINWRVLPQLHYLIYGGRKGV